MHPAVLPSFTSTRRGATLTRSVDDLDTLVDDLWLQLVDFDEFIALGDVALGAFEWPELDERSGAALSYTSGTRYVGIHLRCTSRYETHQTRTATGRAASRRC